MRISTFTESGARVLIHAGCAGSFQKTNGRLQCDRCGRVPEDPREIAPHAPVELPKVPRGYAWASVEIEA